MTNKEINVRYRAKKLKQGWKYCSYLMPVALKEEVRSYIKARATRLNLMPPKQ